MPKVDVLDALRVRGGRLYTRSLMLLLMLYHLKRDSGYDNLVARRAIQVAGDLLR